MIGSETTFVYTKRSVLLPPLSLAIFTDPNTIESINNPTQLGLPRVGQINFSNCLPINLPIELGRVALEANLIDGTPQELNLLIEAGELEISSSSSFLYLSRNDLELIPNLSISCFGPVGSVLFFSKCKPEQLGDARVAVPRASATSIRLLSLMLQIEYGCNPKLEVVQNPKIGEEDSDFQGALVIGDEALRIDDEFSEGNYRVDMGEWWTSRMKLPMVFGVFVARQNFIEQNPDSYRHISESLQTARAIGTGVMLEQVIERAVSMTGLSRARMETYFVDNLNWRLDESHRESLALFSKLLRHNNLL